MNILFYLASVKLERSLTYRQVLGKIEPFLFDVELLGRQTLSNLQSYNHIIHVNTIL